MKAAIVPTFTAVVDQTGLHFLNRKVLTQYLQKYIGKNVAVSIFPKRKLRSINENNYYWGVVVQMIADETGQPAEDIHNALRLKFSPRKRLFNESIPKSTAELMTSEFEEYLNDCRGFANEFFHLNIPLPNEVIIR